MIEQGGRRELAGAQFFVVGHQHGLEDIFDDEPWIESLGRGALNHLFHGDGIQGIESDATAFAESLMAFGVVIAA